MDINKFLLFAESLKLVRKASIEKDNINVIDEVYTDILPNNGIISKFNLPRTSILIGRKGTGKSTIIQKSMSDISKDDSVIGVYIDVKTLYDGATPNLLKLNEYDVSMSDEIIKYLVYKNFLVQVITSINESVYDEIANLNFVEKMSHLLNNDKNRIINSLNKIKYSIDDVFKNIDISLLNKIKNTQQENKNINDRIKVSLAKNSSLELNKESDNVKSFKKEFETTLLKYMDIKKCVVDNFINIRKILNVKYLYIYLDDYSEIDENAQQLFMDWIIAPLNNLSDDFIKFKVATYPNRFYSGKLDNQKYDEIHLDFYGALSIYRNIARMETMAINFTKRLIKNRFKVYLKDYKISDFFDIKENDLYNLLFDVSLNIPRKLGYILSFCYESCLSCGKIITKASINNATLRYFEEITQKYFFSNKYVIRSFENIVTLENQKELIKKIIDKEIENKSSILKSKAKIFQISNPPTSHFLLNNKLANLLDTIELNGYVTTYNKINDKFNMPSTLFALDYGLCQKHNLYFGRPKDSKLRKYYSDCKFIFNSLIRDHFNTTQIICCERGHEFSFEMLGELEKFSMMCPECLKEKIFSNCKVEISNEEILTKIKEYEDNEIRLDDDIEYDIMHFLYRQGSSKSFSAREIAENLDCNWQLISKRAKRLVDKYVICLDEKKGTERRYYSICKNAEKILAGDCNK